MNRRWKAFTERVFLLLPSDLCISFLDTYERLLDFYTKAQDLYLGGNLGGIRFVVRKPSAWGVVFEYINLFSDGQSSIFHLSWGEDGRRFLLHLLVTFISEKRQPNRRHQAAAKASFPSPFDGVCHSNASWYNTQTRRAYGTGYFDPEFSEQERQCAREGTHFEDLPVLTFDKKVKMWRRRPCLIDDNWRLVRLNFHIRFFIHEVPRGKRLILMSRIIRKEFLVHERAKEVDQNLSIRKLFGFPLCLRPAEYQKRQIN